MSLTRTRTTRRLVGVLAVAALGLGLGACSSSGASSSAPGTSTSGASGPSGDEKEVSIGIPSGWDEGIAVSYLWKNVMESEGYTVKTTSADIGVVFTGVAGNDFDVTFDTWLPLTHASYLKKYGDDMSDLGTWYDNAKLTIAVNEDSPARTIADLKTMADQYGNRLVGIEAGAGLTEAVQNSTIPTYGLDKLDYVISSTPAMLAELKSATASGDNIAVTLWRPHWAYDAYPVRDLEDPEGTLGDAEEIHTYGTKDFAERYPTLAKLLGAFTLTDDQLFSLENLMFNEDTKKPTEDEAATAWLEENPDFVTDLKAKAGV